MKIIVAGLNHKSADVEVREKLAFSGGRLEEGLRALRALPQVREAVILSTCNRVEMYLDAAEPGEAIRQIKGFISSFHGIPAGLLDKALYFLTDTAAVRHIFRVASSLDSMVVGEPQILGQVKDAFQFALEKKTTGVLMNGLMKKAISVAKRVRTETKIAENAVSISFAAVQLARKIFNDLERKSVLLMGAGEMAELAARHLMANGISSIVVANRTFERGCEMAQGFGGRAVAFDLFKQEMVHSDIVICSTGAPDYVLFKHDVHEIMKERKQRPVFIIDISVPRNIDPEVNGLENVYLYNVDDLQGVVDINRNERGREAEKAEEIIAGEVETFERWAASLETVPTIVAFRQKALQIGEDEVERLFHRVIFDKNEQEAIRRAVDAVVNKLIHPPTAALREDTEDRDLLAALMRKLYNLNGD